MFDESVTLFLYAGIVIEDKMAIIATTIISPIKANPFCLKFISLSFLIRNQQTKSL